MWSPAEHPPIRPRPEQVARSQSSCRTATAPARSSIRMAGSRQFRRRSNGPSMSQAVTILYFAWLRERIGTGSEALTLPVDVRTVGDLVAHLAARGGGYA